MNYWILLWTLLISIGINMFFFLIAYTIKTDVFTDITYALTFILLSIITISWKQNFSPVQIVLLIIYNLWAIRIGSYLFVRILKTKVDHRFDKMRNSFLKFGMFWILQALTVFIISIPIIFALSIKSSYFSSSFNYYTLIFIVLSIIFLIIETLADWQKYFFYKSKKNEKQQFINYGLWKDSRHPNYLGEIGFWYSLVSMFLLDYLMKNHSTLENWLQFLWLLSPLYINFLLVFVSGIPLLEIKSAKRFIENNSYQEYINKTPCLVFLIGKKGHINKVKKQIQKK